MWNYVPRSFGPLLGHSGELGLLEATLKFCLKMPKYKIKVCNLWNKLEKQGYVYAGRFPMSYRRGCFFLKHRLSRMISEIIQERLISLKTASPVWFPKSYRRECFLTEEEHKHQPLLYNFGNHTRYLSNQTKHYFLYDFTFGEKCACAKYESWADGASEGGLQELAGQRPDSQPVTVVRRDVRDVVRRTWRREPCASPLLREFLPNRFASAPFQGIAFESGLAICSSSILLLNMNMYWFKC